MHLEQEDDPAAPFTAADDLASRVVIERFSNRKHEHHLRTAFAIQRRRRLLGRLQAIRAALDLANGLLSEDDTLSDEFLTTWQEKTAEQQLLSEQQQTNEGFRAPLGWEHINLIGKYQFATQPGRSLENLRPLRQNMAQAEAERAQEATS